MAQTARDSEFARAARDSFGSINRFARDLYSSLTSSNRNQRNLVQETAEEAEHERVTNSEVKGSVSTIDDLIQLNNNLLRQFRELSSNVEGLVSSITGGGGDGTALGALGLGLGAVTLPFMFGGPEETDLVEPIIPSEETGTRSDFEPSETDITGTEGVGLDVAERTAETLNQPLIADIGEISEESGLSPAFRGMGLPGWDQGVQPTSVVGHARGRPHHGADYYVPEGEGLRAQAGGVVRYIGSHDEYGSGNYGRTVVVEYDNGMVIQYSHLAPESTEGLVEVGQQVERGQLMAMTGASGTMWGEGRRGEGVTPPHIHLEATATEDYNRLYGEQQGGLVRYVEMPNLLQPHEVMGFDRFEGNPEDVEVRPIEVQPAEEVSIPEQESAQQAVRRDTPDLTTPVQPVATPDQTTVGEITEPEVINDVSLNFEEPIPPFLQSSDKTPTMQLASSATPAISPTQTTRPEPGPDIIRFLTNLDLDYLQEESASSYV